MSVPRATYRLQFRQGMDFDRAATLVPYLARLGISHLYASPLFQAVPGSTHGYDVTDHGRFDDSLGGMEGFVRLSAALKAAEMGLILDIVPNHMAASPHNSWWRDVLRHGCDSDFAGHFDIDWSARLTLPTLGKPFAAALEAGEFALGCNGDGLTWRYYDLELPLAPESWRLALNGTDTPADDGALQAWLAAGGNAAVLRARLEALSTDRALLQRIHDRQAWRLVYWRAARDMLSYRRFFEVSDLVGVRVEDERVFDDVHRLLFEMVDAGHIDGIRVDHVDGLADPSGYLRRLQECAPGNPPIWIEKILGEGERLQEDWAVAGTTGYEAASAIARVLTSPDGIRELPALYEAFSGAEARPMDMLARAKRELLTYNLAAELARMSGLALAVAQADPIARDWGPDSLRRALIAIAVAMPVYRTYLGAGAMSVSDADVLRQVEAAARGWVEHDDPEVVSAVLRLIATAQGPEAERLRTRFQQTTGALMAKGVEDTLFYRYACLLSGNEVGGQPELTALTAEGFDAEVRSRAAQQPAGLNATATHDTKRGEDARMRIAAVADRPAAWAVAARGWDALLLRDGAEAPEPRMRWLFYQSLLGAWDPASLPALADRMAAYVVKAAREAKRATSWTGPDEAYEAVLVDFVHRALTEGSDFVASFAAQAAGFIAAGARKSLVQLALKLTLPGIPDIYQGTETADLSLVDPDNRSPVDFTAMDALLDDGAPDVDAFSRAKAGMLRRLLALRREAPALFAQGSYLRLEPEAEGRARRFGFVRRDGDRLAVILAELTPPAPGQPAEAGFLLPEAIRSASFDPPVVGGPLERQGETIAPGDGFADCPVLVATGRI